MVLFVFYSVCLICLLFFEEEDEVFKEEFEVDVWVVLVVLEDFDEVEVFVVFVFVVVDLFFVLVVVIVVIVFFVDFFFGLFLLV